MELLTELILCIGLAAGAIFPPLLSRQSIMGLYRPSRELLCGSTRIYIVRKAILEEFISLISFLAIENGLYLLPMYFNC